MYNYTKIIIDFTRYPEAALLISYRRIANIINNERKSYWITNKDSLENLASILENHDIHKKYYQDYLFPGNQTDGHIIFFADDGVLSRLNNAKALYIDGNFKVIVIMRIHIRVFSNNN